MDRAAATPLVIAAAALVLAAAARQSAPPRDVDTDLAPEALQLLTLGHESTHATALWMRTVDRYASGDVRPEQIAGALRRIGALDPTWAEPWFFGILMLDESEAELRAALIDEAATLHPSVPWFAWRAGISRLGENREVALKWLRQAASAPGADPAYAELLAAIEDSA